MNNSDLIKQLKDVITPEEMRAEIYKNYYHDPLIHAVFRQADFNGMSAEDRYTILAYHAIKEKNNAQLKLMELLNTIPFSSIVIKDAKVSP